MVHTTAAVRRLVLAFALVLLPFYSYSQPSVNLPDSLKNEFNIDADTFRDNLVLDQELLSDGDIFSDRYTLEQVILFEILVDTYCSNYQKDLSDQGNLESKFIEILGDRGISVPPRDSEEVRRRTKVAVAALSLTRSLCASMLHTHEEVVSDEQADRELFKNIEKMSRAHGDEILENGYITVNPGETSNWEEQLLAYEAYLLDKETVLTKLVFQPTSLRDLEGFEYVGSEPIGAISEDGFDAVVSLYRTSFGVVSVQETDLSNYEIELLDFTPADGQYTDFKVERIADQDVYELVMREPDDGNFESQFSWEDSLLNRDYSISINMNLSDPQNTAHRKTLLDTIKTIID